MIVVAREDPVRVSPVVVGFRPGVTVAEMVAEVPLRDERIRPYLQVRIGDYVVDRRHWGRVVPHDSYSGTPTVVVLEIPLRGGSSGGASGGRKIGMAVAAIAIIAVSMFTAGGGLAFLGPAFQAGAIGATLASAAVSVAGAILLQGLAPDPEEPRREQQLGFAGANNDFSPGSPLPRVIGTHRISPPYVVPPFRSINGDDEYVTAVFGMAGNHDVPLDGIMNGEVPLKEGDDVEIELRDGGGADIGTPLTLVDDTVAELGVNIRMSEHQFRGKEDDLEEGILLDQTTPENSIPRWHRVRTRKQPHRFVVNFLFDQGMIRNSPSSGPLPIGVFIVGRFRRVGDPGWVGLPRALVVGKAASKAVRVQWEFRWVDSTPDTQTIGGAWDVDIAGDVDYDGDGWAGLADEPSETVPAQWRTRLSGSQGVYYAGASLHNGNRTLRLYLERATYPDGTYEFEFKKGFAVPELAAFDIDDLSPRHFSYFTVGGVHTIDTNPTRYAASALLTSVQSIWPEHPIKYESGNPAWLMAVRVRNMQLDRVSVEATGIADADELSNPAKAFRHVLTGKHAGLPVTVDRLDEASLNEWGTICTTENYQVNLVAHGDGMLDLLKVIARAGYASPKIGAKIGVAIDRPRPGPVGMINQNNARDFSIYKPLLDRPHAILATFSDQGDEYRTKEIAVYDEGYSADGAGPTVAATKFERVAYRGITSEAKTINRAEHDFRWMRHRSSLLSCVQDVEYLEHSRGDRVYVETDILGTQSGRGRVEEVVSSTEIVIDEQPRFGPAENDLWDSPDLWLESDLNSVGAPLGVIVRRLDGTLATGEVQSYDLDGRLVLVAPVAGVGVGDLVITGPLLLVAKEMIVLDVVPGPDMTATITMVDYAEQEMYA